MQACTTITWCTLFASMFQVLACAAVGIQYACFCSCWREPTDCQLQVFAQHVRLLLPNLINGLWPFCSVLLLRTFVQMCALRRGTPTPKPRRRWLLPGRRRACEPRVCPTCRHAWACAWWARVGGLRVKWSRTNLLGAGDGAKEMVQMTHKGHCRGVQARDGLLGCGLVAAHGVWMSFYSTRHGSKLQTPLANTASSASQGRACHGTWTAA